MHLLRRSPQIDRCIPCNYAARGSAVSGRKVGDSRLSRIAEKPGEDTSERERERENESKKGNNGWREKDQGEPDGRTVGEEKRGCCLARSLAGASIDAFARAFMNELPYSDESSPLSARAVLHTSGIAHMRAPVPTSLFPRGEE